MQPKSNKPYTKKALQRFKEKIDFTRKCYTERMKDPTYATKVPQEIGLKLTNRCDLRCTHCFQWNDVGFHRNLEKKEVKVQGDLDIDIEIIHSDNSKENLRQLEDGSIITPISTVLDNDPSAVSLIS